MQDSINIRKLLMLIFTTIISIVFICMTYYGITRYFYMHMNLSYDKYVLDYKNLPKKTDSKVIVSLSTTDKNIYKIKPIIKSLLDQTVKVDNIILNLPPTNVQYNIPEDYKKVCKIYHTGINYGKYMNCIPTLLRENEDDTIIILLKDDIIYGKDYIETILEKSEQNPDKHIIEGNDVILIKPKFVNHKNIVNVESENKLDNNWLKRNLLSDFELIEYKENYKFIF